eukprot:101528_1
MSLLSTRRTHYVFGLIDMLPEFLDTTGDAPQIVKSINEAVKRSRSSPLQDALEELHARDFHIPLDIIDLIKIYEHGTITYHYAKQFQRHIEHTLYISPMLFGYFETFLFFSLFTFPFLIRTLLTPLLITYGFTLFIHGIFAILSYHKCAQYEIFIRQFKQSLHSNDRFYEQHKERYETFANHRADITTHNDPEQLMFALSNPSNNSFAYIAYQRWLNVKQLELQNDKFTRSRPAFCLSLSKYWLPSSLALSFIVFEYASDTIASIWVCILVHAFNALGYCYFRVAEDSNPRLVLRYTILYVVAQDIFTAGVVLLVSTSDEEDNAEFWLTDVACPIFYGLASIGGCLYLAMILRKIWMHSQHQRPVVLTQVMWLVSCTTCLFFSILFGSPSWGVLEITAVFVIWMIISYYMMVQQLIERIMTGLKTHLYVLYYMAQEPQKWLKRELNYLFVPNKTLWHWYFENEEHQRQLRNATFIEFTDEQE